MCLAQARHESHEVFGGYHGAGCVVWTLDWDIKECHHRVADVLVDNSVARHYHLRCRGKEGIHHRVGLFRPEVMGHGRKGAQVYKENRDFNDLPVFNMHVASVADIGILACTFYTGEAQDKASNPSHSGAADQAVVAE